MGGGALRAGFVFVEPLCVISEPALLFKSDSIINGAMTEMLMKSSDYAAKILRWYTKNARELPWRVGPMARKSGMRPDPYRVWLSEIMLQQTTVATVTPRYQAFLDRWPRVHDMAASSVEDILEQWAGLGYYARARNLHKCAVTIAEDYDGVFPQTEQELIALPGIGAYTAAAIAAIAFDQPAVVVDGNIERVVSRLFAIDTPLPASKPEIKACAAEIWPKKRSGDFAQALMDLGATICTPRNPICEACPVSTGCAARAENTHLALPRKAKKAPKPHRFGAVFVLINAHGRVLLERRPDKGLLGGMLGFPGTAWADDQVKNAVEFAPRKAPWRRAGEVAHTFTHFHLSLEVFVARTSSTEKSSEIWGDGKGTGLPTVMKKALVASLRPSQESLALSH